VTPARRTNCPSVHYAHGTDCTLRPGHPDIWHQTHHPDTGVLLRYRQALGTRHTQEWVPDLDSDESGATGEWTTLHHVQAEHAPTPTVPADLDRRIQGFISGHTNCGTDPATGWDRCACGMKVLPGQHGKHLARELSLLVRGYYDMGLAAGQAAATTEETPR